MPTPYQLPQTPMGPGERRLAPRMQRPVQGRYLGGVCAGLAEHLGLNVRHIRLAFAVAGLAGGAGVGAYLLLWAFTPPSPKTTTPGPQLEAAGRPDNEAMRNVVIGLGLLVVGAALFAQQHGVDLRLGFLVPLLTVAGGAALAWSQLDETERGKWLVRGGAGARGGLVRLGMGIALATLGAIVLVARGRGLAALWDVGIASIAVLAGAGLIAAPWVVRLWGDLRAEQAQRIRETERADIAAHLHDSVLQTLALIQRKADDPAEVTRLVRAQERELRGWLYAGPRGSQASLASAATEVAHEVEDLHGLPIELVVTGDRPLDAGGHALVQALREALLNAVRHGAAPVSAYVEVGSEVVQAFVRDHGPGFEMADVPPDRLGVRESILGRMSRQDGSAALRRLEDGTEVFLSLPVTAAESPRGSPPAPPPAPPPVGQPDTEGTRP